MIQKNKINKVEFMGCDVTKIEKMKKIIVVTIYVYVYICIYACVYMYITSDAQAVVHHTLSNAQLGPECWQIVR